jgi:hypothetical protein
VTVALGQVMRSKQRRVLSSVARRQCRLLPIKGGLAEKGFQAAMPNIWLAVAYSFLMLGSQNGSSNRPACSQ